MTKDIPEDEKRIMNIFNVSNHDDFYGILVEGRKGRKKSVIPLVEFTSISKGDENFQLIDDYKIWFCNW